MVVPSVINVVFSNLVFPASVMLVSDPFADSDSAVVVSDLVIVASGAVVRGGNFRKITKMSFTV